MKYHVVHRTSVRYAAMAGLARFNLRLKPADWPGQTLLAYWLDISPSPTEMVTFAGPYVANISRLVIAHPLIELVISSTFDIEIDPRPIAAGTAPNIAEVRARALTVDDLRSTAPANYIFASPLAAAAQEIGAWAQNILTFDRNIIEAALDLARTIQRSFVYDPDATESDTPAIEAFRKRRGVCQDFAHIMIIALRSQGLAAAYVSGYLRTLPPPGQARLIGADATHAWVNLWCGDNLGWVGFDPTNGCIAGHDHIFTAMGRDYGDVAPIDGVLVGGSGQSMTVSVDVSEI